MCFTSAKAQEVPGCPQGPHPPQMHRNGHSNGHSNGCSACGYDDQSTWRMPQLGEWHPQDVAFFMEKMMGKIGKIGEKVGPGGGIRMFDGGYSRDAKHNVDQVTHDKSVGT